MWYSKRPYWLCKLVKRRLIHFFNDEFVDNNYVEPYVCDGEGVWLFVKREYQVHRESFCPYVSGELFIF